MLSEAISVLLVERKSAGAESGIRNEPESFTDNVGYWGKTGKHLLALSLTGFDPQETCAALDCCYANRPLKPFRWAQISDLIACVANSC